MNNPVHLALAAHPATPQRAIHDLQVALCCDTARGLLTLRYRLRGELHRLHIPEARVRARRADGLWQHTCFEAFVATARMPAYLEFNFSPSGEWAAYAFAAPRQRNASADPDVRPAMACEQDATGLCLTASLPLTALASCPPGAALGLSAVLEHADGSLSHWALAHPGAQPDFHDRAGWVAELPGWAR